MGATAKRSAGAGAGAFTIDQGPLEAIRADFAAGSADEAETAATIQQTYAATGFLPDPHTAVGLAVAARHRKAGVPMVALSTAHPAKFPDAVRAAVGAEPPLPDGLARLISREERLTTIANDPKAVEAFIADHVRRVAEKV
jgi:threonine synthase